MGPLGGTDGTPARPKRRRARSPELNGKGAAAKRMKMQRPRAAAGAIEFKLGVSDGRSGA